MIHLAPIFPWENVMRSRRLPSSFVSHSRDAFEQRLLRLLFWDSSSCIGLLSLAGTPGLGFFGEHWTAVCYCIALLGSGSAHSLNAYRCRRRRSLIQGPCFLFLGATGLFVGSTPSVAWNSIWLLAAIVWLLVIVLDFFDPMACYLR